MTLIVSILLGTTARHQTSVSTLSTHNAVLAAASNLVHHRQAPASTECCRSRRQRHTEVRPRTQPSPARRAALAGRSSADAAKAVCNGTSMSAAQSTAVHDGLLHPHLRHCSSPASVVRRLPSAVRTSYRGTGVRCSVVGPFLCLARRPRTRYQTTCEIRHVHFDSFRRDL